jgi:hypothetical protein
MAAVLASSHPERLLDEAGVRGGQFPAVDPGQKAAHSGSIAPKLEGFIIQVESDLHPPLAP